MLRSGLLSRVVLVFLTGAFWAAPAAAQQGVPQPPSADTGGSAQPTALTHTVLPLDRVEWIQTPPIDLEAVRLEDEAREDQGLPPRFAIPNPVRITPETAGTWERPDENAPGLGARSTRPCRCLLWRLRIGAPGAASLNLGFSRFVMPPGGRLFVYASDDSSIIRAFTDRDNATHGELWTPVILSDDIVVELTVPEAAADAFELELTSINHGYRGFGAGEPAGGGGQRSGSCNVDVICPEGDPWRNEIPAIAVISTGGSLFCTGFMVNNTAYDLTPYFMTAYHCGIDAGNAPSLVVYWNYENSWCRPPGGGASGGPGDGTLNQSQTGSFWRAGYASSDFTLVELDQDPNPAWQVSYAGWDRSTADATSAVGIHQPNTDEKRISFEYQPTTTTSYLGTGVPGDGTHVRITDWDLGTTEPGSSGSPLFDQNHHVIGQLHGGYASCTSQTSDWYGRFSRSWTGGGTATTRLSNWLDAANTGAMTVDTLSGLGMVVTPAGDVLHVGPVGGPFTNPTVTYTLSNPSPAPVNYSVQLTANFGILLDGGTLPITGTLAGGGGTTNVIVSLGPAIDSLAAGVYVETVVFTDLTNARTTTRQHTVDVGQTQFSVTPTTDLQTGGPVGGPFTGSITYTVTNDRPDPVSVQVAASDTWISLNGSAGPLTLNLNAMGDTANAIVGISSVANSLSAGTYNGTVSFTNLSGGQGDTTRNVILEVGRATYTSTDTPLPITDNNTTTSIITVPDDYCIGDVDVDLNITHTYIGDLVVELTSPSGVVVRLHDRSGGSNNDIVTTYDEQGGTLPDGPGSLSDFNQTGSLGDWILTVTDNAAADQGTLNSWALHMVPAGVNCPNPVLVYSFPMNTNPGWTTQGQWAFGSPTGGGGAAHGNSDPTGGATGQNVYGYNLNGDYANNIPEYHLTSTPIDCTGLSAVQLKFQRWLNVEQPTYDHAYVRVSNDGFNWVTVWANGSEVADAAWGLRSYNISAVADNQPTVYLRWTMGATDGSWQYAGWNIDDVEIWAVVQTPDPCGNIGYTVGDINNDGLVNALDIGPFTTVLMGSPTTPFDQATCAADVDGSGEVNMQDLGPFVQILLN